MVWIGLLLQYFVGFKWGLTPNAGYCDVINPPEGQTCGGPWDWFYHMILPWMTFAILFAAIYARMIRANVMDTLGEDYVRTARAKGAPERQVISRHVLRNALLPVVTMLGLDIGVALGGAIFTEAIFNLPGLGRLAIEQRPQFRPADVAGGRRLRNARDHRLQPDRGCALRLHRPEDPTDVTSTPEASVETNADDEGPSSTFATCAPTSRPTTGSSRPSTASRSASSRGRPSAWSASPAAARA